MFEELVFLLRMQVRLLLEDTTTQLATSGAADLAAVAIFFAGCCCVYAMFTERIRDTVMERIAFAFLAFGCFARAVTIFAIGTLPLDGAWLCFSIAFYCVVLLWKHFYVIPRRPDYRKPEDMPIY